MKKLLAMAVLAALPAMAETVYFSAKSTTYHKAIDCKILVRSSKVYSAERRIADNHGLKPCRTCYGQHKTDNSAWSKPEKSK